MKTIKLFMLLSILCVFTGCENKKRVSITNNQQQESSQDYSSEYYEVIGLSKFKEVYASSDATIIYFGASWCGNCVSFKTYAQKFAKENNIKVYFVQIDAENFTDEDNEELSKLVEFTHIPYITVYKNKEQLYGEAGVKTDAELITLAKTYGVTK